MGYSLYVTRKEEWSEEGPDISEAEWIDYVNSDPEMVMTGMAEITTPKGEVIRIKSPLMAQWAGHSKGYAGYFDFFEGQISTRAGDKEVLAKLLSIAKALDARVQGEEGEFYESVDDLPE